MGRLGWMVLASAGVIALSFQAIGQEAKPPVAEPPKPPAPAEAPAPVVPAGAPQDKVDILANLDAWYKVAQGDLHVGYVHEVFRRAPAGGPWRYTYDVDSETELMIPDPKEPKKLVPYTESLRVNAKLDDTYTPWDLQRADHRNGVDISSWVISDDAGKKIDVQVGSDRKSFPVKEDEEIYYSRFLMFIQLRQTGALSRPGIRRAMVFSPRADDKAPVAEVQLEINELVKREYMGKKDVPVTRVTYLKPPPAASRDAELVETFVDKYGRIVEEVSRSGLRQILGKEESEAVGKETRVRPGGRRDPFRKDLAMLPPKVKDGGAVEEKKLPIDPNNIGKSIKDILPVLDELKKAKDEGREAEGQKLYDKVLVAYNQLKTLTREKPNPDAAVQAQLEMQVEALRTRAEEIWGGLRKLMVKLENLRLRVYDHFNRDETAPLEKGIEDIKKALERKELEGTPEFAQVIRWVAELEPLIVKSRTRLELSKKKLILTGTLLQEAAEFVPVDARVDFLGHQVGAVHDVRFVKPTRMALINDKTYRVGDVVEGEGVRIEKIWAHGVQVSLREETRDIGIRQK